MLEKLKSLLTNDTVFYSILLILVAVASFGLGRQSVQSTVEPATQVSAPVVNYQEKPLNKPLISPESDPINDINDASVAVVASKTGTKYHLPTCPGAKQIKEANLITFDSVAAAKAAGYTPAANCKF
jgi:hypothetical protein